MDTGTVPASHIHTVDVSVNCHCVCMTFHTGSTGMMKDGLKSKEIFVNIYLQNKNRKTTVVTRSASGSHIPTGNQDSTYTTRPEFLQTRPEKLVFNLPCSTTCYFQMFWCVGSRRGLGKLLCQKTTPFSLDTRFMHDELKRIWKAA